MVSTAEGKTHGTFYGVFEDRTVKVIGLLKGVKGKVLDIGCGDATIALRLKQELGCVVEAIDLIQANVLAAQKKGIPAKRVDLNNDKLPFRQNTFDAVFAGEILEHVVDSDGLLLEIKMILKKDGVLIITVPNIASWYNRILLFCGFLPHFIESGSKRSYGTPFGKINGHVKAFTKRSVLEMLRENGYKIEAVKGSGFSRAQLPESKGAIKGLIFTFFFFGEKIFSFFPGLATNIVVKAIKQ